MINFLTENCAVTSDEADASYVNTFLSSRSSPLPLITFRQMVSCLLSTGEAVK